MNDATSYLDRARRSAAWLSVAMLAMATPARAESVFRDVGVPCTYGIPEIDPPAGSVPANWPSFEIHLYPVDPTLTRMTRVSDNHVVPLRFAAAGIVQFAPMEPLVVGESYLVEHPHCEGLPPHTTLYDIVDPIVAPASAGTVAVHGPFASNTRPGVCHRHYFIDIELTPDPAFAMPPWSSFTWGVDVDDFVPEGQPLTTTHQRLAFDCGGEVLSDPTLAEGHHDFVVRAWQRYAADVTVIESAPISLDALCADVVRVDDPTLRALNPIEIMSWDTDMDGSCAPDANVEIDAAVPMDASVGSFDGGAHTEPDTHPNCGCGVASGPRSVGLCALWIALALAWRTRRASRGAQRSGASG